MKRINVLLSDELAEKLDAVAARKEMAVAEVVRRSLEGYLSRFPVKSQRIEKFPVFKLGNLRVRDLKEALYRQRLSGSVG